MILFHTCCPGICRKVKLHYFLVGHGHCDGDGEIGQGGTAIANKSLQTFEKFRDEMKKCFQKKSQSYADVERYYAWILSGITCHFPHHKVYSFVFISGLWASRIMKLYLRTQLIWWKKISLASQQFKQSPSGHEKALTLTNQEWIFITWQTLTEVKCCC